MAARSSSRQKILNAASELARTAGSAHLSLDAVAARAGISKGGLLYHFPTKSVLLTALVQQYIEEFEAALNHRVSADRSCPLEAGYFRLSVEELQKATPPPSGLLAALSENPEMLAPVRRFNRALLDRMKAESADEVSVLMLFLVLEGMRFHRLFGTEVLDHEERALLLKKLGLMLDIR